MSATVCSGNLLQPLGYVDGGMGGGVGGGVDRPQGDEGGGGGDDEHQAAHQHLHQVYVLSAPGAVSGEMPETGLKKHEAVSPSSKEECNNGKGGSADGREG